MQVPVLAVIIIGFLLALVKFFMFMYVRSLKKMFTEIKEGQQNIITSSEKRVAKLYDKIDTIKDLIKDNAGDIKAINAVCDVRHGEG
jgi:hypothetical protein